MSILGQVFKPYVVQQLRKRGDKKFTTLKTFASKEKALVFAKNTAKDNPGRPILVGDRLEKKILWTNNVTKKVKKKTKKEKRADISLIG